MPESHKPILSGDIAVCSTCGMWLATMIVPTQHAGEYQGIKLCSLDRGLTWEKRESFQQPPCPGEPWNRTKATFKDGCHVPREEGT